MQGQICFVVRICEDLWAKGPLLVWLLGDPLNGLNDRPTWKKLSGTVHVHVPQVTQCTLTEGLVKQKLLFAEGKVNIIEVFICWYSWSLILFTVQCKYNIITYTCTIRWLFDKCAFSLLSPRQNGLRPFWKERLLHVRDYCVISTSIATNQRREFAIITYMYVIVLMLHYIVNHWLFANKVVYRNTLYM